VPRYTFTAPPDRFPITVDLRDNRAAWKEMVEYTGEMLRDIDGELPSNTDWEISVANEGGQPVTTIRIQAQRYSPSD
jgi:hypothetical protein